MVRQSLKTASLVVMAAALAAKAVGFMREIAVAHAFGTGTEYDAFVAGITVPAAICTLLEYGVPNLLVPVYARARGRRVLPVRFWLSALVCAAALAGAVAVFAPFVVSLVTPGLAEATSAKAVGILRAYAGMIFLGVFYAAGIARLQGQRYFTRPALGYILLNLIVLASIIMWSSRLGTYAIVWGMLGGTMLLILWYWWPTKGRPDGADDPGPGSEVEAAAALLGRAALGVMAVVIVGQLFFIVDRWWGSYLAPGSISALVYAITITNIPVAVIGTGMAVAIFPFLHDALSSGNDAEAQLILERAVRYLIWLGVPLAVMLGLFSEPLIGLFLERGRFDAQSTRLTAGLLPFLALGTVFYSATAIWDKVYYAQRRVGRLAALVALIFAGKFLLSWCFVSPWGIKGLALATGLSYVGWGTLMYVGIDRAHRPAAGSTIAYLAKVVLLTLGGGITGHYLWSLVVPALGGTLTIVRFVHVLLGTAFVWTPLLLMDGRWGIDERRKLREAISAALGHIRLHGL